MENFSEIIIMLANAVSAQAALGIGFAFSLGAAGYADIPEEALAAIRRWHGKLDERYYNVNHLVDTVKNRQPAWVMPDGWLVNLTNERNRLKVLFDLCHSVEASASLRAERNSLLTNTVGFCLHEVGSWADGMYAAGTMTADDVHQLGFLLRSERGGTHKRAEATDARTEVKVKITGDEHILVVVDQSAGENAGPVRHGWPHGVKYALIVILTADGQTEILRKMTTHLHNRIHMPTGSRGKLFIIKAAFLRHVDDEPQFGGNEPTFSIPLTTADLGAVLDRQHHADYEEHLRAVEHHRRELEAIDAARNAAGANANAKQ
jgi:hypothetical protein